MSSIDEEYAKRNAAEKESAARQTQGVYERERQRFETNPDGSFRSGSEQSFRRVQRFEEKMRSRARTQEANSDTGVGRQPQEERKFHYAPETTTHQIGNFGELPKQPSAASPGGGGGGGGGIPDLSVLDGRTGAVIVPGTEELVVAGRGVFWVIIEMNVNGTAGFQMVLGSMPYV